MILERKAGFNLHNMQERFKDFMPQTGTAPFSLENISEFAELLQVYSGAMNEVSTKLEILDSEFQLRYRHNPIHHMECRMKSPESIMEKLRRLGKPTETAAIRENVLDIAGIRVVCNYTDDIYAVADLLAKQSDITIVRSKDYIAEPKANGYRSLHIVLTVPVFLSGGVQYTPVEVQFRTITMDYWASLEHKLRYKNELPQDRVDGYFKRLYDCAERLKEIEAVMQEIHREINEPTKSEEVF